MRLVTNIGRIHGAGAEVIAVSVDSDERQAGMSQRWGLGPIQLVADPGGEAYLQKLGLYNPDDRGGIALPAMIVLAPSGEELYRYQGRDFADRTTDDDVFAALDGASLEAVDPGPWVPGTEVSDDLRGYFRPEDFGAYFRGNRFAAIAIGGRLPSKETAAVAREHRLMAEASLEAWDTHRVSVEQ